MPDFIKKLHIRKWLLSFLVLESAVMAGGCQKDAPAVFTYEESVLPDGGAGKAAEGTPSYPQGEEGSPAEERTEAPLAGGGEAGPETEAAVPQAGTGSVCVVHICGAVKNPGVYELPEGSRIMDAVTAGGGFLETADQSACNLAEKVTDGCQIYIMTLEESSQTGQPPEAGIRQPSAGAQAAASGLVDLNTADAAALKTLPGIGDSRAEAIIAWREENGGFSCIEDIMKVSGIKEGAFRKIKERITVGTD